MVPCVATTALVGVAKLTEVVALVLAIVALAVVGPHALFDQQVIQVFGVLCSAIVARAGCAIMPGGGLNTRLGCASGGIGHFCLTWVTSGGGQDWILVVWHRILQMIVRACASTVFIAVVGLSDACRRRVCSLDRPHVHGCATLSCAHQRVGKTMVSCRCGLGW